MTANPLNLVRLNRGVTPKMTNANKEFADEQVLAAMRDRTDEHSKALRWFFEDVRGYAIGVWRKKYRDLTDEHWNDIFSDASIKLISRVKKGLVLQPGTQLKSYFTTVVEYTVLDHFAQRRKNQTAALDLPPRDESVTVQHPLEARQTARLIREKLLDITENEEQVKVMLLVAKGYRYKEIIEKTAYQSEGACRNAYTKGKKRVVQYIMDHPAEGKRLRDLLLGQA